MDLRTSWFKVMVEITSTAVHINDASPENFGNPRFNIPPTVRSKLNIKVFFFHLKPVYYPRKAKVDRGQFLLCIFNFSNIGAVLP